MESAIISTQFLQPAQAAVVPESKLLAADKSSGQMIWTYVVRLKGEGTRKCRHQTRKQIDDKLIAASWVVQDKSKLTPYEKTGVASRDKIDLFYFEYQHCEQSEGWNKVNMTNVGLTPLL